MPLMYLLYELTRMDHFMKSLPVDLPRHNDTILSTPQDATDIPNSAHPVHVADTRDLSQRLGSEALQYGRGQDNGMYVCIDV